MEWPEASSRGSALITSRRDALARADDDRPGPSTPLLGAIDGHPRALLASTTLFASAAAGLPGEKRRTLTDLADGAPAALIRIVWWALLLAPRGVFALVAGAVAQFGPSLLKT